jgi:hypothetical protein
MCLNGVISSKSTLLRLASEKQSFGSCFLYSPRNLAVDWRFVALSFFIFPFLRYPLLVYFTIMIRAAIQNTTTIHALPSLISISRGLQDRHSHSLLRLPFEFRVRSVRRRDFCNGLKRYVSSTRPMPSHDRAQRLHVCQTSKIFEFQHENDRSKTKKYRVQRPMSYIIMQSGSTIQQSLTAAS